MGKMRKCRAHENGGGAEEKEKEGREPLPPLPSFLPFFFFFALSQFRGPDYLGAWNRLTLDVVLCMREFRIYVSEIINRSIGKLFL